MPWTNKSASRFTRKARSPKQKRQWQHVADSALRRGASEASAIRQANAVVRDSGKKKGGRTKMARRKGRKGRKRGRK